MGLSGYQRTRQAVEVEVDEPTRPRPTCLFNHELRHDVFGFTLEGRESIKVRVDEDSVRIGCVRMSLRTWLKLSQKVNDLIQSS
jgi:hypothetical protein